MRNSKLANQIRILAFSCKSKDVFSCEFGNEFADRVEGLLQSSDAHEDARIVWVRNDEGGIDYAE